MLGMRFTHCAHSYWYHHFVKYKPPFPIQQMYFKKKRKKCCLSLNKIRILTEDSFLIYCWFCLFCILQFLLPHPLHTLVFTSIFFYPSLLREIIRNFPEIILTFSMLLSFFFFKIQFFIIIIIINFFWILWGRGEKTLFEFLFCTLSPLHPPPKYYSSTDEKIFPALYCQLHFGQYFKSHLQFWKKEKERKNLFNLRGFDRQNFISDFPTALAVVSLESSGKRK